MDDRRWRRLEDIFNRALERAPEARDALLDELCADDPSLADEVRALLAAERAGTGADFIPREIGRLADEVTQGESGAWSGRVFGAYRLLEPIGSGGMGTVYRAERADDAFEKRVALKVIRGGIADATGHARFRAERQILARLEHPGIARLLDGGTTEDGVPFVVMEYVDGAPITTYAHDARLDVEARLWLFLQVCSAVQYAHGNLVIHRDLKPANILVTREGEPKLLDFGIAKLLDPDGGGGGSLTRDAAGRLMTPEYASPEQVRGGPVGTGTDVYALGVLLYQLLSGSLPFRLDTHSPAEIERIVTTREPERPSKVAVGRSIEPDLDHIVLKAMRKEPERRYLSVAQLADDIRAYLAGLPVSARPDSLGYRTAKFVRRHRLGVAVALGVLALSGFYTVRLAAERDIARTEAAKAEQVAAFVTGLFRVADPDAAGGREVTARALLDSGAVRLRSELADQPAVRAEMLSLIGYVYDQLGLFAEAEPLLEEALELSTRTEGPDSETALTAKSRLRNIYELRGDLEEAERMAREVVEATRALRPLPRRDLATRLLALSGVLSMRDRFAEAEAVADEAMGLVDAIGGVAGDSVLYYALAQRGSARQSGGRLQEAQEDLERAVAVAQSVLHPDNSNLQVLRSRLAGLYRLQGDFGRADSTLRVAIASTERVFGDHPDLAFQLTHLSNVLKEKGEFQEAEALLRRAMDIHLRTNGPRSPAIASVYNNMANLRHDQDDIDGALEWHARALDLTRELYGDISEGVATSLYNMASVHQSVGDLPRALELQQQAFEVDSIMYDGAHLFVVQDLTSMASMLSEMRSFEASEARYRQALQVGEQVLDRENPQIARVHVEWAKLYLSWGRPEEAVPHAEQGLRILSLALEPGHWELGAVGNLLGEARWRSGDRSPEALALMKDGYETLLRTRGPDNRFTQRARLAVERAEGRAQEP